MSGKSSHPTPLRCGPVASRSLRSRWRRSASSGSSPQCGCSCRTCGWLKQDAIEVMLLLRTNMIWTWSEQINYLAAAVLFGREGRCEVAGMSDNWDKDLPSEGRKAKVNRKCHVSFFFCFRMSIRKALYDNSEVCVVMIRVQEILRFSKQAIRWYLHVRKYSSLS